MLETWKREIGAAVLGATLGVVSWYLLSVNTLSTGQTTDSVRIAAMQLELDRRYQADIAFTAEMRTALHEMQGALAALQAEIARLQRR